MCDFQREVAPRGFTVALEIDSAADVELHADAASLTNALWNLLDNAVKYSREARAVHVSVRREPSGVAIAVQDESMGIPKTEQREIFERFVRGKQASEIHHDRPGQQPSIAFGIRDPNGQYRSFSPSLATVRGSVQWSPDGTSLLASATDVDRRQGIFRVDVVSGETRLIVPSDASGGVRTLSRAFTDDWSNAVVAPWRRARD